MPTVLSAESTRRRISVRLDAQVLRREGHVVLDDVRDNLVVRVLEHQAHRAPHLQQPVLVRGVDAVDEDAPLRSAAVCR